MVHATNLVVSSSLPQLVLLPPLQPLLLQLLLQAVLVRIRTSRMVRPSIPEPYVPYLLLSSALPTFTFSTMQMAIRNVTSLYQLFTTSAVTVSLSIRPQRPSPANLLARPASVPAVTTSVTMVLGAYKRTRLQGCSFRNTLPLQG